MRGKCCRRPVGARHAVESGRERSSREFEEFSVESEFLSWLRDRLPEHPRVRLGAGDDAAVVNWPTDSGCVLTTDLLSEGTDFESPPEDWRRVGRKALAMNLSDLAAMAAQPVAALVSVLLPRTGGLAIAQQLFEGMKPLVSRFDIPIAGGDTNSWEGPAVVSVTAVGQTTEHGIWRRSGARPDDRVLVTGSLGGSILGHHFDFLPRVHEALLLNARYRIHAATDISDGLSLDLANILVASGVGAVLDTACIPISAAASELARTAGGSPREHALGDGEDFELILIVPPGEAARLLRDQPLEVSLTDIGRVIGEPGLWEHRADGGRTPLEPRGYRH